MKMPDPWMLLRSGETRKGLELLRQVHDQEATPSRTMELGVAYLWVQQYQPAFEHFLKAIQRYPESLSSFYGMAGAAKWCLGGFNEAVSQWLAGLNARYADAGGLGIKLPLLLFVASVLRPQICDRASAERQLMPKLNDVRLEKWPGPIAKRLLTQINAREFRRLCERDDEAESRDRKWLAEFYEGVLEYSQDNRSEFEGTVRKLTDTSRPEWSDENFFLERMWSEEFFIARYEAQTS